MLTAMLMTVFLGCCALSVDVGHWYAVHQRVQQAADAAAMAAVVGLPGSLPRAQATAATYSGRNGFPPVPEVTTVTVSPVAGRPTTLDVTVTTRVDNYFAGALGLAESTISATSRATFSPPLSKGSSTCNTLGSDPEVPGGVPRGCPAQDGRFFLSVGSNTAPADAGDPVQSTAGGADPAFRPAGYTYDVTVRNRVRQLDIAVFDPTWVDTDPTCDNAGFVGFVTGLFTGSWLGPTRGAAGLSSPYCTGDDTVVPTFTDFLTNVMDTKFTVTGPGVPSACTTPRVVHGFNGRNLFTILYGPDLRNGYRRWEVMCRIPDAQPGTYRITVAAAPPNFFLIRSMPGSNHFSIRATSEVPGSPGISVAPHDVMSVYANTPSGGRGSFRTTWPLAEVTTAHAGQTLRARFYDVGDCVGPCTLTMSILQPDGQPAPGCDAIRPAVTRCAFPVPTARYDGRWQSVDIPIPSTYRCTPTPRTDCLYRVRVDGGQPRDVSTWTAALVGPSVHLDPVP